MPEPTTFDLRRLRTIVVPAGRRFFSVFSLAQKDDVYNASGRGDTRFAPLFSDSGDPIGTLYVARTETAALLETVFHEIQPFGVPAIDRSVDLAGRGIRQVEIVASEGLRMVDLRDDELKRLEIDRAQLVATSAAHYGCTRRWAETLRAKKKNTNGIIWGSRVAEVASERSQLHRDLANSDYSEVMVLFADRTESTALLDSVMRWNLDSPMATEFVETIADHLGAVIV